MPLENQEASGSSQESVSPDNLMNQILEVAGEDYEASTLSNEESLQGQEEEREEAVHSGQSEEGTQNEDEPATREAREYYTADELIELGSGDNFDKLDTSKIPPEHQAIYKSFQAMATRKQQQLVDKEKELSQKQASPPPPPIDYSKLPLPQRMIADPFGARQELTNQLYETEKELREADQSDDFFKAQKLLIKRGDLKDQLGDLDRHLYSVASEFEAIRKAVPDLPTKSEVLTNYLNSIMEDDPFTPEELSYLTNPSLVGGKARKIVKLVNKLYTQNEELKKSVQTKISKPTPPPPAEKPQSGGLPNEQTQREKEVKQLRKRAQQTGELEDWASFIAGLT